MVSPTGASIVTTWRYHLIPPVRSSGVAAHFDGEVRPAFQEQAELEKHAKDRASVIMAIIRNVQDTTLH
jgi:hypothetical protein